MFQHTAARRRLVDFLAALMVAAAVSTHSRPKAAGNNELIQAKDYIVSTHSRPKAAGTIGISKQNDDLVSTHSRPKAAGSYK